MFGMVDMVELYPLVITNSLLLNRWHLYFVDLPIQDGDFPVRRLLVYQRVTISWWVNYNCNILMLGLYIWLYTYGWYGWYG